ncbi:hypothetical protein [Streptomyces coeruleorubidus]|uniref:hypothetical protein n=1 Tax=Streptomyces coeruleorubidus TaxID=116188 RepID=UPI003676110D
MGRAPCLAGVRGGGCAGGLATRVRDGTEPVFGTAPSRPLPADSGSAAGVPVTLAVPSVAWTGAAPRPPVP